MNKVARAVRDRKAFIAAAAALLLLAGCSGDDGAAGAPGAPGTPGVGTSSSATSLTFALDSVNIGNPSTVEFTVTNEDGVRFTGLAQGQARFTVAKLVPGTDGNPSAWQSYINRNETIDSPPIGPGTETKVQATSESNGTLTNNLDGTYTYTFSANLTNITSPMAVSYQPTLTHRLGVQISGGDLPVTNATYDWRPSDGATTGIETRDIAMTTSCNECHNKLALHGGGRTEVKYCVTCHNPGSTDANSGNTVDMKVMIHKIHRGESLPSVEAGGSYVIWGNSDRPHDYSEVVYPQDIRNCTKCHDPADTATPDAANFQAALSAEACGSCHDNVNFADGTGHSSGNIPATNADCTICHSDETNFAPTVAEAHVMPAKTESAKYAFSIVSATNTGPGQFPVVTYKVTNPATGAAYDINDPADPVWACVSNNAATMCNTGTSTSAGGSRLAIDIAWNTQDYTNDCDPADVGTVACQTGASSAPASVISLDGLIAGTANAAPVDNGDGTFTVTSLRKVPATASGTAAVALEGHPAGDYDGDGRYTDRVPVKNVIVYKSITDATPVKRREVVDIAKCNKCHDQLSLHGSNRTDEPLVCVMCHNANNTDLAQRRDTTSSSNIWPPPDGKTEESIDFKTMIHAIHGAQKRENGIVVYGNNGSTHDYGHVGYPGILNDCNACHKTGTFAVPLQDAVLANTVLTGASRQDPSDDTNITPTTAVCSSCHDTDLAKTHMIQNGGMFDMIGDTGSPYNETCSVCHGEGRLADVAEVHALAP